MRPDRPGDETVHDARVEGHEVAHPPREVVHDPAAPLQVAKSLLARIGDEEDPPKRSTGTGGGASGTELDAGDGSETGLADDFLKERTGLRDGAGEASAGRETRGAGEGAAVRPTAMTFPFRPMPGAGERPPTETRRRPAGTGVAGAMVLGGGTQGAPPAEGR